MTYLILVSAMGPKGPYNMYWLEGVTYLAREALEGYIYVSIGGVPTDLDLVSTMVLGVHISIDYRGGREGEG